MDERRAALQAANTWNVDNPFPTVYVLESQGILWMHTELSTSLKHG